jgi:ABC-type transporter Mla subunit MlaD
MFDFHVQHLTLNVPPEALVQLIATINSAKEEIMATQAQTTQAVNALKDQVVKSRDEIVARLAELQTAVDNAGNSTPEMDAALEGLRTAVQGVDDIVPDAPPADPGTGPTT